ncbi:MAG: hypothetical protein HW401_157 [Parcubacteria group bacterium]|nr:hypothetical protein [Parcubacteria group bacterium]
MKIKRYNLADRVPVSIDEAFLILDNFKQGIPYEAIRYLRDQKSSKKITSKIIHSLQNTYTGFYYDKKENYYAPTPLWYATVAETHLSKDLTDPVIMLFSVDDDWDAMSEQGEFLIGLLSDTYPKIAVSKVMNFIDMMVAENSTSPYLYLFDVLQKADLPKQKSWFLKTFANKNLQWDELFASLLADLGITEAIPVIKERLTKMKSNDFNRGEYEYALEKFAKDSSLYSSYHKTRGDWEEHFIVFESIFFDEEKSEPILKTVKTGRNEPCPCGKLKADGTPIKYKKCCGVA